MPPGPGCLRCPMVLPPRHTPPRCVRRSAWPFNLDALKGHGKTTLCHGCCRCCWHATACAIYVGAAAAFWRGGAGKGGQLETLIQGLPCSHACAGAVQVNDSMRGAAQEMARFRQEKEQQVRAAQAARQSTASSAANSTSTADTSARAGASSGDGSGGGQNNSSGSGDDAGGCPYIGFSVSTNFLDSQSLWDATMAHAIAQALGRGRPAAATAMAAIPAAVQGVDMAGGGATGLEQEQPAAGVSAQGLPAPPLVLHVCGKFHAEGGLGIPEHLEQHYAPGARLLIITFLPAHQVQLSADQLRREGLLVQSAAGGGQGGADGGGPLMFVCLTDGTQQRSFASQHPV